MKDALPTSRDPVTWASPPQFEGIHPALPKERIMASPDAAAKQDNAESPQDLLSPSPLFASRAIIRLKSYQVPKSEVYEEVHSTPK